MALQSLKALGLIQQTHVVPDAGYRFKHILTQEVAYASLLEHQRRELHGRVGSRIEELGQDCIEDHLERLAHHFARAEQPDFAQTVQSLYELNNMLMPRISITAGTSTDANLFARRC